METINKVEKVHNGNLEITKENQNNFQHVEIINGGLFIGNGIDVELNRLKQANWIVVSDRSTLAVDFLEKCDFIEIWLKAFLRAPKLSKHTIVSYVNM